MRESGMSGWNAGYITDIPYTSGWYGQQSPLMMALTCQLCSVNVPMPKAGDSISLLELGCGQGFGAMVQAASNPGWRVTAVDFNPAHIAAAREWAAEAGLTNVTFIEADLATLAEDQACQDIPEADFVTVHGVWSWVPRTVQDGIVRLLRSRLRAGGVLHLSYNALPAWGPAIGLQRIIRESGRRLGWRSDRQAEEGLAVVKALLAADARQLERAPFAKALLKGLEAAPASYIAHEYMNEHWQPCFMQDVAAALSDAKLEWVGSSQLTENFPALTLTDEQRKVADRFEDPLMREMVKDMCLDRSLRHDVFVRGARRFDNAARDAALMDVVIGMNVHPNELPLEVEVPAGQAQFNAAFYKPIVQMASRGAARVGDLLALPDVDGRRDNPAELLGMLVGVNLAYPVLRPGADPEPGAMRFNHVACRRLARSEALSRTVGLASHRLGNGAQGSLLDMLVLDQVQEGRAEIEGLLQLISPPPEGVEKVRAALEHSLKRRMPILRKAGVF
jgi:SAM-dependent methyltransferase